MSNLPKNIKLSPHARERLLQRKDVNIKYNRDNIMRSGVKWYGKDDLIHDCALYRHCCYVCRKSKQIGYITDGYIEIIYNKTLHVAITVLEVKDKFKPITQFIKPETINQIKIKKENKKMETELKPNNVCKDCGKESIELNHAGLCPRCTRRKSNMKSKGQIYVRYLDLSEEEKQRVDKFIAAQAKRRNKDKEPEEEVVLTTPNNEGYYTSKAQQTELATHPMMKPVNNSTLTDQKSFINVLKEYGCDAKTENLEKILDILINTAQIKDLFTEAIQTDNKQLILNLETQLTTTEQKLQSDWENNGFKEIDDIKFKGFLMWRKILKESITFWKNLYITNNIPDIQKPIDTDTKQFQITTESISTIFNTRRPFTRIFYAKTKDEAYNTFKQWLSDRNLHEDPKKTVITELKR